MDQISSISRWRTRGRLSRKHAGGLWLGRMALLLGSMFILPLVMKEDHTAWAGFTLPPAPWGEFTPFYGAAPCIPDFQDVGVFSPAEAKADGMIDKLVKKKLLDEDDVKDLRRYDEQDRDRRVNRNFYGNLSFRIQAMYQYFEGDSKAAGVDPSFTQTSPTTTIPSRSPIVRPSSSGSSTLYGGNRQNVHDIDMRRMRLQYSGCVYRDMQFHIELHADGLQLGIRDLDMTWTKLPWMNVMIGQIKMPNSRERQLSSGAVHFPERAFASQGIAAIGRETGVQLSGMDILDVIDYKVMAATGFGFNKGQQAFDDTANLVYAGRLTAHPFGRVPFWAGDVWNSWAPLLEGSVTYAYAPKTLAMGELNAITSFDLCQAYGLNTGNAANATSGCFRPQVATAPGFTLLPLGRANINPNAIGDWHDLGFDTTFMYRGFYANFEAHNMTYSPNNGNPNYAKFNGLRTVTYAVDLGYFLIPRELELMARYQYLNINTGRIYPAAALAGLNSPSPIVNRNIISMREYDIGMAYYLSRDHRHKIRAVYNFRDEFGSAGNLHNNGAQLDLQLAF